jgi:nicotinate-nucleotide adenylyltransferase
MIKTNDPIPSRQAPSIILFGGTFDPPHAAHAACLTALAQQFPSSKILVVPAADPPPTNNVKKTAWLSFDQRMELCRTMVDDAGLGGQVEVSDIEASLPHPSYTVNTLEALLEMAPDNPYGSLLAVVMGADQFANFNTWRNPDQIIDMADLILVPRPGQPFTWPAGEVTRNARIWTLDVRTPPASSTGIRKAIQEGSPVPAGWLQPSVVSRIQQWTGKTIKISDNASKEAKKKAQNESK